MVSLTDLSTARYLAAAIVGVAGFTFTCIYRHKKGLSIIWVFICWPLALVLAVPNRAKIWVALTLVIGLIAGAIRPPVPKPKPVETGKGVLLISPLD
jgi:hypothetical protein